MTERRALTVARVLTCAVPLRGLRKRLRDALRYALWCPAQPGDGRRKVEFRRAWSFAETFTEKLVLPQSAQPRVSIIIPVYNNYDLTRLCLQSIVRNTDGPDYEVILADDASTDATREITSVVTGLRLVRSPGNLRFLRNCNNAARCASGEYVLFLNNDTQVQSGWLRTLVDVLERDPTVGLVGSMLLNPDMTVQEIGMTMSSDGVATANGGKHPAPWRRAFDGVRDVDYPSGASILLRRSLWEELGGFDEHFAPAYYEDADLAYRVRSRGLRTVCQPASRVIHCCGASSGQRGAFEVNRQKFCARWLRDEVKENDDEEN